MALKLSLWLIRITFAYFSSKSGDISDMATQFPMSSSSKLSFTGRSLFTLVTYTQLLTFRSLRCCNPPERGDNDEDACMLLTKEIISEKKTEGKLVKRPWKKRQWEEGKEKQAWDRYLTSIVISTKEKNWETWWISG